MGLAIVGDWWRPGKQKCKAAHARAIRRYNQSMSSTTFNFGAGPVPAHRHPNGGGWVADTATVAATAYVGPRAQVCGRAQVYGGAQVYGDAQVSDNAQVYGWARVYDWAQVSDNAQVYDWARVYGDAQVYGDSWVYGDAQVYGDSWVYGSAEVYAGEWSTSPYQARIGRWGVCEPAPGHLMIGCTTLTLDEWLDDGERLADEHELTADEVTMLRAVIHVLHSRHAPA
jgi:hypothetical protein